MANNKALKQQIEDNEVRHAETLVVITKQFKMEQDELKEKMAEMKANHVKQMEDNVKVTYLEIKNLKDEIDEHRDQESVITGLREEIESLQLQAIKMRLDMLPEHSNMVRFERAAYRLLNEDLEVRLKFQNMILDWDRFGEYVHSLGDGEEPQDSDTRCDFISEETQIFLN